MSHGVGVLRLSGPVTMQTAPELLGQGRARIAAGDVTVDFSAVTAADSAALALLLDWQRAARAGGHRLSVRGLPAASESLARLYGIEELLPPVSQNPS